MKSPLVPQPANLRTVPGLYNQSRSKDPLIYIKVSTKDREWSCYIAEGGRQGSEYEVFALLVSKRYGYSWAQVPLRVVQGSPSNTDIEIIEPTPVSRLVGTRYLPRLSEH